MEIVGERVRLRKTALEDQDAIVAIRQTPEVMARWRGEDLIAEFAEDLADEETTRLTILDLVEEEIVGLIQFFEETEPEYRHASLDIYIAPGHHRRGYASDAIATLVSHLFDYVDHHRLTIDPAADNAAAIACYTKVGFRPVGVMHQYEEQADGSWADGLLMELLRSDWNGR